jgi:hypothetical protein
MTNAGFEEYMGSERRTIIGPATLIAEAVQEIVAKETRRALREREDELTQLVRTAVGAAIAEMLDGRGAA